MLVSAIFKALTFYFIYRAIKSLLARYQTPQANHSNQTTSDKSRSHNSKSQDIVDVEYRVIK